MFVKMSGKIQKNVAGILFSTHPFLYWFKSYYTRCNTIVYSGYFENAGMVYFETE